MASSPVSPPGGLSPHHASHEPKPNAETDLEASPKPAPQQPANHEQPIATLVPQTPQVYLTFLLVSGRRKTMSFDPKTTVGRVKELVWNAWPSEWQDERPPAPSYFRILHLGKILQDDDTLTKLSFPASLPPSSSTDAATVNPQQPSLDIPSSPVIPSSHPPDHEPHSPAHDTRHTRIHHHPHATIVHLSIRSYAPPADDDLKKDKKRTRWGRASTNIGSLGERGNGEGEEDTADAASSSACCGCVIC